uniref:uncharacterized protein LOC122583543 n=1 Tax=Erigeron canadensis TaxID=72917 RepID=UPI001CB9A4DF|nr:uncharacterized protein LOC122583543 [Erigeron canadensis]
MTGVPRTLTLEGKTFVTEHRLNERKHIEPIHKKKRSLSADRDEAARKEVDELLKAGIIRESPYPIWIANPVIVKKKERRVANIGKNLEAYVNDMVIKSRDEEGLLDDIRETFSNLQKINMKLNPKKCSFGVEEGKFLGYYINKPIKQILVKPDKSGRVAKWAIELGEHEIEFRGRHAIKGQILADFITDVQESKDTETYSASLEVIGTVERDLRKLYTDEAASSDGCGAGPMLVNPEEKEFTYALNFEFIVTNNEAEYEALLAGLRMARDMKIRSIQVYVDSQLVARQVKGEYEAKQETTQKYLRKVQELRESFSHFEIEHIRRSQNKKADALSKLASLTFDHMGKKVLVEVLKERSIEEKFGIPQMIISENGPQFARGIFPEFCKHLQIKQSFASVYHPQGNGQVEVTNREIIKGIERRLGRSHKGWVDELPLVLWANTTAPKQSNGETPFSLAFGSTHKIPSINPQDAKHGRKL